MRHSTRAALCVALAASALPAAGQTLRVAVSSPVTSIDPHYHNLAPNISLSTQIFDRLIEMDEHAHLVPGLAASWKLVAPDTWELKLRDAKFQNGNEFVPDDVVFTMVRQRNQSNVSCATCTIQNDYYDKQQLTRGKAGTRTEGHSNARLQIALRPWG